MYVDKKPKITTTENPNQQPALDWQAILYHGHSQETVPLSARNQITANNYPKRINVK